MIFCLSILFIWLAAFLMFSSIGLSFHNFLFKSNKISFFDSFWFGWGLVILFLMCWHLFFPVNGAAQIVVLLAGTLSSVFNYKRFVCAAKTVSCDNAAKPLLLLMIALFIAYRGAGEELPYDAGLYHLQSIKWMASHPVVPGLGNLHERLAFNSSYFLYLALFKSLPLSSAFYGSGLLLIVAGFLSIASLCDIDTKTREGRTVSFTDILFASFVVPFLYLILGHAATTSPGLPVFIVGLVVTKKFCEIIFQTMDFSCLEQAVCFIVFVSLIGITIKLSFIVFAWVTILSAFAMLLFFQRKRVFFGIKKFFSNKKPIIGSLTKRQLFFCLCACLVSIHLLRGIILSGYPLYPSPLGGANVEWRVPKEQAVSHVELIKSWARAPKKKPQEVLKDWRWLSSWTKRMFQGRRNIVEFVLPMCLSVFSFVFLLFVFRKINPKNIVNLFILLLPAGTNLVFWFFFAPEPRFAGATFYIIGLSVAALLIWVFVNQAHPKTKPLVLLSAGIMVVVIFITYPPFFIVKKNPSGAKVILEQEITDFGLRVYVPVHKHNKDQCWDAPLPCTPYFNPKLKLRGNDISQGFKVQ